ncbi:MAG: type II toxin-antitoxin system HicB family antitoxin [Acidobacteria bacterium]|nr:type II toxin-antitoxin system HicB family antitoxin [Acidobacteriota bacterium]
MAVTNKRINKRRIKAAEYLGLAEYIERAMRHAHITKDETGYAATVPLLRGCISCGDTELEARENLMDAIEAWVLTGLRFSDRLPPIGNAVLAYNES